MKEIKYLPSLKDLNAPYEAEDIQHAISEVVSSGWYLQGKRIHDFEEHYAAYIGTRHCISCGNGASDALKLMFRARSYWGRMQPGDEVLVAANTYIATILAITSVGLTPILIEPNDGNAPDGRFAHREPYHREDPRPPHRASVRQMQCYAKHDSYLQEASFAAV